MSKKSRSFKATMTTIAALTLSVQMVSGAAAASVSAEGIPYRAVTAAVAAAPSKIVSEYNALLAKPGQLPAAMAYLKAHIQEVSKSQATIMLLHLENAVRKQLPEQQKRFEKASIQSAIAKVYYRGDSFEKVMAKTKDASLKALLKQAASSGYKLETSEGMFYPIMDYSAFKVYVKAVNPDIQTYIELMATESAQTNLKDAAIVIGYQQLVGRAIQQESFLQRYAYSNRAAQVRQLYQSYEALTFYGANNTPLFNYDTKEMQPNAIRGYEAILQRSDIDSSPYLQKLQKFMNVAKENGYKLTPELEKYRKANLPL
ncbi:hypothetical protein [Cohnella boryungensis]|uniref:SbsC C-terminal domain-containing protein n=1 Tax=Cohnella boryungensis TaxID=768479 RepID=A0ABV8SJ03_9BACL